MKKIAFTFFLSILLVSGFSAHIKGGFFSYEFIGDVAPNSAKYKIKLTMYMNCNPSDGQLTNPINFTFFDAGSNNFIQQHLDTFCRLDDHDVMATIKNWCHHPDKILSILCRCLVERKLLKIKLQTEPFDATGVEEKRKIICNTLNISGKDSGYFVFTGETSNTTYDLRDERINILFKDGTVKDISKVDNALIHQDLSSTIKKYYFCYYRW